MSTTLNSKELTLVYDSTTSEGRKALAYAYSRATKVNRQDVSAVSLSTTFVRQVLKQLNLRPKDLFEPGAPLLPVRYSWPGPGTPKGGCRWWPTTLRC